VKKEAGNITRIDARKKTSELKRLEDIVQI